MDTKLKKEIDAKEEGGSQLQLAAIVEESHDAIIGKTLDGIITSWNGGAKKMFGYSPEEVIGKPMTTLFPVELKEELPRLLEKVRKGEVIADYDSVWLRKDSTRANVEFSISPVHTEEGTIIGASLVGRDISARKKEEELMRQIQLIVENSQDAIFATSLEGMILSWNMGAQKMLGYSADEILGKSVANLFVPERIDDLGMLIEKIKQKEYITNFESPAVCKDGSIIEISSTISPIIAGEGGSPTSASVIIRDITERKKSELHIRELNEVRNKFISIISHQLRTPLTSVNWNLEMILNGDFGKLEDVTRKFLLVTHGASVDITNRIHDLLSAMDIEEGRIIFHTEEVAIDSIVASVVAEMKKRAEIKGVTIQYIAPADDLPAIEVDSEKIRTAVTKLIENGVMYTKENGKVVIKLSVSGGVVRFEINDTGVGIPEAEQHHIFTRFFRASNAAIMAPDAFGLGLFITKSFITQHRGNIGFESKEGEGSTFWFEVPIK